MSDETPDLQRLQKWLHFLTSAYHHVAPHVDSKELDALNNHLTVGQGYLSLANQARNPSERNRRLELASEALKRLDDGLKPHYAKALAVPPEFAEIQSRYETLRDLANDEKGPLVPPQPHDLKNILTSVIGRIRQGQQAQTPQVRSRRLAQAQETLARAERYVQLALTQNLELVHLHHFLPNVRKELPELLNEPNHPVVHKVENIKRGPPVWFPAAGFMACVKGLVDNAVKALPDETDAEGKQTGRKVQNKVVVRYRLVRDQKGEFLEVQANQQGPGFSEEGKERVEREREEVRQGLTPTRGLASIDHFARSHGGELFYKSFKPGLNEEGRPGQGAMVGFRIRLQRTG